MAVLPLSQPTNKRPFSTLEHEDNALQNKRLKPLENPPDSTETISSLCLQDKIEEAYQLISAIPEPNVVDAYFFVQAVYSSRNISTEHAIHTIKLIERIKVTSPHLFPTFQKIMVPKHAINRPAELVLPPQKRVVESTNSSQPNKSFLIEVQKLRDEGRFEELVSKLENHPSLETSAHLHLYLMRAYFSLEQPLNAEIIFDKIHQKWPYSPVHYLAETFFHFEKGNAKAALIAANKYIKNNPGLYLDQVYWIVIHIYLRNGLIEQATKMWKVGIAACPKSEQLFLFGQQLTNARNARAEDEAAVYIEKNSHKES